MTRAVPHTHLSMMLPVAAMASWTACTPACFQLPWGRRQSVPLPCSPTGKQPRTLIRVHGHGPAFPDKSMAGISHGSHPILWVSRTAREGWLLIRAVVPLPGGKHHSLSSRTGGSLGEAAMYNNHYGNMPLWFRVQNQRASLRLPLLRQIGKGRAADLNLCSPQHLVQGDLCSCAQKLW